MAGFMLAGATMLLLVVGTGPISYIRESRASTGGVVTYITTQAVMLVGALIFVLGIDLVKEALWDTRNRVNRLEYLTIASIMVAMTVWDFVFGVLFGIIASCESTETPNGSYNSSYPSQVSSLWSRIPNRTASVHSTLARPPCRPSGDLVLTEPIYGRYRNRPQLFDFRVFSSLVQSLMSKNQFGV